MRFFEYPPPLRFPLLNGAQVSATIANGLKYGVDFRPGLPALYALPSTMVKLQLNSKQCLLFFLSEGNVIQVTIIHPPSPSQT